MNKWDVRFVELAYEIAKWSSCVRPGRKVGAVIVKDKRILTTGYNGAAAGIKSCAEKGFCFRETNNIPSGVKLEQCEAIHAEQNAILQAAYIGVSLRDATLYCTLQPCVICAKMIINAGISKVVFAGHYQSDGVALLLDAGVKCILFERREVNEI